MKKYIFGLTILASLLVVSCTGKEETQPAAEPEVAGGGAYFLPTDATANVNPTDYSLDALATTFSYKLGRENTEGALTVNIINKSAEIFTVPATVTFAAGQKTADLTVSFSDVPAEGAVIDLEIAKENASIYGQGYNKLKGSLNKLWANLGTGQFFDQLSLMSDDSYGIQNVTILKKRSDSEETYRIVEPYANTSQLVAAWGEENLGGSPCPYIELTEYEADGKIYFTWNKWWYNTLVYDGPGTDIKAYLPSALSSSQAAYDALSCWADEDVIQLYPYWYIDGLGGFGPNYPVFIAMPGVDLEAWLEE